MSPADVTAFEAHPEWLAAVALRKRDDMGKERGRTVPELESLWQLVLPWLLT